jgi:hypothetical protein
MTPHPLEIEINRPINPLWLGSLRWLRPGHYDTRVGQGALRTNCRATANGHFVCHLIPSVLSSHERQEFFRISCCREEQSLRYSPSEECRWRRASADEGWHPERLRTAAQTHRIERCEEGCIRIRRSGARRRVSSLLLQSCAATALRGTCIALRNPQLVCAQT